MVPGEIKKNKWNKGKPETIVKQAPKVVVKSTNNSNRQSPLQKDSFKSPRELQVSPDGNPLEDEDDFMRQVSITDCDSPKRQSVRTNYMEFSNFTSDLNKVNIYDLEIFDKDEDEELSQFDPSQFSKLHKKLNPSNVIS